MRGSHTLFGLKRGSLQGEAWGVHSTHPTITSKVDIQDRRWPNIFPLIFTVLELQKLSPEVTCPVSTLTDVELQWLLPGPVTRRLTLEGAEWAGATAGASHLSSCPRMGRPK